jgi:hypothetical protein
MRKGPLRSIKRVAGRFKDILVQWGVINVTTHVYSLQRGSCQRHVSYRETDSFLSVPSAHHLLTWCVSPQI